MQSHDGTSDVGTDFKPVIDRQIHAFFHIHKVL
jgi:hypothetical protein